jgi:peptidoglycan/LPS O-acetylase OafA/YrhL
MSPNLDILRATAVMYVFVGHVLLMMGFRGPVLAAMGRAGVLIFFVHTSFVLMQSLERSKGSVFAYFYTRRAFRIYPLSMLVVASVTLLHAPLEPWAAPAVYHWLGWKDLISNFLLTQNLTFSDYSLMVLWTLPLEVQMYVILPFLFLFLGKRNIVYCYALWALAGIVAQIQPHYIDRASVAGFVPCFLGGVIAYRLSKQVSPKVPAWLWLAVIAVSSAVFIMDPRSKSAGSLSSFLFCLSLGTAVPFFLENQIRWLTQSAYQIAKHSYGIYLAHEPILWFAFDKLKASPAVQWSVFILLMLAVPVALYRFVEHPMIRVGTRLAERFNRKQESRKPMKVEAAVTVG